MKHQKVFNHQLEDIRHLSTIVDVFSIFFLEKRSFCDFSKLPVQF